LGAIGYWVIVKPSIASFGSTAAFPSPWVIHQLDGRINRKKEEEEGIPIHLTGFFVE
jgi:hypothetical protein